MYKIHDDNKNDDSTTAATEDYWKVSKNNIQG